MFRIPLKIGLLSSFFPWRFIIIIRLMSGHFDSLILLILFFRMSCRIKSEDLFLDGDGRNDYFWTRWRRREHGGERAEDCLEQEFRSQWTVVYTHNTP